MTAKAMMRPTFKRPRDWGRLGKSVQDDVRKVVTARLIMGLTDMQKSILETPVYTGRTLVNFRWSIGAPVTTTRPAVKDPPLPGKTSSQRVGDEPRRAANQEIVVAEFHEILAAIREDPFQDIYLFNNLDHYTDVEYGTYATAGRSSRTPPGGMTRRGETLLEYAMMGYFKRVS